LAVHEVSAAAGVTLEAVSAVPSDADALSGLPQSNVGADGINASGDFVSGHARILKSGPDSFFHQRIAMTDPTGFDFNTDLTATGLRSGAFDNFEISMRFADLNGFHGWRDLVLYEGEFFER
jgi:hypothetical protein